MSTGAWEDAVLATSASLAEIESEINKLTSAGENTYTATAVNLADATNPITTGVTSVDVSTGKGVIEILGIVNTTGSIYEDKHLIVSIRDSADDSTFTEIDSGQRVYYRLATGAKITLTEDDVLFRWVVPSHCEDYIKAYITSDGANLGKIDIYAQAVWGAKLDVAKEFLGEDLERMLKNAGLDVNFDYAADTPDILLDVINNPEIFARAHAYLTLALIYEDLGMGSAEDDIYRIKCRRYYEKYNEKLNTAWGLKNLDFDLDDTVDEYKDDEPAPNRIRR